MAEVEVPKAPTEDEKADSNQAVNGDGDRQVLAPAEGPREDLINTAIKFLQNPKVTGSPLQQKRTFLSKKGLTQDEINIAVERSGVRDMVVSSVGAGQARAPPPGYQPGMMAPGLPAYGPRIPQQSRWAQLRDLTMTSFVVVSVSYGMYQLYRMYIEPLIRGKSAQEKRLERLESEMDVIHKSVTESLSDISKTLAAIQMSITTQSQQSSTSLNIGRGITDLKSDISSLRSLLLSKNQFPPPPTTTPILPSWQLAGASPSITSSPGNENTQASSSVLASSSSSGTSEMSASPAPQPVDGDVSKDSSEKAMAKTQHESGNNADHPTSPSQAVGVNEEEETS